MKHEILGELKQSDCQPFDAVAMVRYDSRNIQVTIDRDDQSLENRLKLAAEVVKRLPELDQIAKHVAARDLRESYNNGWNAGAGFAVGALLGLGIGAIATAPRSYGPTYYAQPAAPYPYVTVSQAHVRWCLSQYRSYNPATNTYTGYDGYQHDCAGP